jgi:hypothetical protein
MLLSTHPNAFFSFVSWEQVPPWILLLSLVLVVEFCILVEGGWACWEVCQLGSNVEILVRKHLVGMNTS